MAILTGVGSAQNQDSTEAIRLAYQQATQGLGGYAPSLLILFASPASYDQQQLLSALVSHAPQSIVIGCSSAGEITSTGGSLDNSVALIAIYSDQIRFVPGVGNNIKDDPQKAGRQLAEGILKSGGEKPRTAIILPDGLAGNGAGIVRGIIEVLGNNFPLTGGSAGDDYLFKQTYQYYGNQVLSGSVVGLGLYGNFSFGVGVRHGWIPIGTPRIATKSSGNILYELDGKPAIEIYENYFGKDKNAIDRNEPLARMAVTYPLGIPSPGKDSYLIRDPLTVDERGAITCTAEIPQGSEVWILIGSAEEAIDAAEEAAKEALAQLQGKTPKVAILFDCIARKKLLMTRRQEEINRIRGIIGLDVPLIGFYTYGEQAPLGRKIKTCFFHNETDVILLLSD